MIKEFWADESDKAPILLSVDAGMDSAGYIKKQIFPTTDANGNIVKSFLKSFLSNRKAWFKGDTIGRIAIVGFSQGCNGLGEILKLPFDRNMIDIVIALDGPSGAYSSPTTYTDNEKAAAAILPESYSHWVAFALDAAQTDGGSPPKRAMVLTYSLAGANSKAAATTKATVTAIIDKVYALSPQIAPPCLVATALIGANPDAIDPPGPWPSQWNHCGGGIPGAPCSTGGSCPCKTWVQPPWPVEWQSTVGNFICVGFNAASDKEASCGMQCSESAHVFQSWWVGRQVWKEVIRPRWKECCLHELATDEPVGNTIEQTAGWSGLGATPTAPKSGIEQIGTTFLRRSLKNIRLKATGAFGEEISCGYEGVFANLFAPGEWESVVEGITAMKAVVFVAAAAIGTWLAKQLLGKQR
jgi:hypothetical protein